MGWDIPINKRARGRLVELGAAEGKYSFRDCTGCTSPDIVKRVKYNSAKQREREREVTLIKC